MMESHGIMWKKNSRDNDEKVHADSDRKIAMVREEAA